MVEDISAMILIGGYELPRGLLFVSITTCKHDEVWAESQ